jgi:predicted AAA+ superfamily ATPase
MNVNEINDCLIRGEIDREGVFPHLDELRDAPFVFRFGFGLDVLPEQPGLLVVRGPRQYGKSTWLEGEMRKTIERWGPGSALYLSGDDLADAEALGTAVGDLVRLFPSSPGVRRLFIDEITAVPGWERALKRRLDAGELRQVLVVTTGSKATDLRRGIERLPGRKGRLDRTSYLFTPVSYGEFRRVVGGALGEKTLPAYFLSGGCPAAGAELAARGKLPEYLPAMIRDWVYGECAASGRQRASLLAVMEKILRLGGTPVGQAKLAREAGLANNTVAAGYVELLADLMCVGVSLGWDGTRQVRLARKPAKYHLINLLAAVAWHPARLRSVEDIEALPPGEQGKLGEWLVAQELWRRAAIGGEEFPERLAHWQAGGRELDFVVSSDFFLEVKRGKISPLDFAWFPKVFPGGKLLVIGQDVFEAGPVRAMTMEDFLLENPGGG